MKSLFSSFSKLLDLIPSFLVGVILIAVFSPALKFWDNYGFYIIPSLGRIVLITLPIIILVTFFNYKNNKQTKFTDVHGYLLALFLLFMTDWLAQRYSLLLGPSIRGLIVLTTFLLFIVSVEKLKLLLPYATLFITLILSLEWLRVSNSTLLFSDDHPVMLFRLALLKDYFPNIPFYSPLWNGGFDARDFFASGVLNIFTILSPIIYFTDIFSSYNVIVALLCFIIAPYSLYLSARLMGYNNFTASCAVLLGIGQSLFFYRWALKYGTIGCITSVALTPLCYALYFRLLSDNHPKSYIYSGAFLIVVSLTACWTPSIFVLLPIVVSGLIYCRKLFSYPGIKWMLIPFFLINILWLLLFIEVSNVVDFSSQGSYQSANKENQIIPVVPLEKRTVRANKHKLETKSILSGWRTQAEKFNPLILLLLVPALAAIKQQSHKVIFTSTFVWLFLLATFVPIFRTQLEFERMYLFLLQLSALPIASLFGDIMDKNSRHSVLACFGLSFILVGALSVLPIVGNRSVEGLSFSGQEYNGLLSALDSTADSKAGVSGRAAFLGFVLHELEEGHLAPLALKADRGLIASSPFHNLWWYRDLLPEDVRAGGESKIENWLDTFNVTTVITHDKKWLSYLQNRPEHYEVVWKGEVFSLFNRKKYSTNAFLEGSGSIIKETPHSIVLKATTSDVIIKYRYFPFLAANNKCLISAYQYHEEVELIRLTGCNANSETTIQARTGLDRLYFELFER